MALYEMVLIARNDVSAAQVEALVDELGEQLGQADGKIVKREFWGLRTLAYKIKKNRRGHYVLLRLDAPFAALAEAERRLRLNEDVLRFLTLKVEAIDEAPSVMMQRKGEERGTDRSARGPRPGGRFESGRSSAPRHSAPAASESVTEGE